MRTLLALADRRPAPLRSRHAVCARGTRGGRPAHGDRGSPRETRVWIVDEGDHAWIEAATPERDFYRDLLAHPEAELVRGGAISRVRAEPVPGPEPHGHLRALLRAKYGLADWWVGLLQDTSRSVAVRIAPAS
jgi:hypothetical protein